MAPARSRFKGFFPPHSRRVGFDELSLKRETEDPSWRLCSVSKGWLSRSVIASKPQWRKQNIQNKNKARGRFEFTSYSRPVMLKTVISNKFNKRFIKTLLTDKIRLERQLIATTKPLQLFVFFSICCFVNFDVLWLTRLTIREVLFINKLIKYITLATVLRLRSVKYLYTLMNLFNNFW